MSREYRFIRAGSYEFHLRYVIMTQDDGDPDGDVVVTMRPGKEIRLRGQDAKSFRAGFREAIRPDDPGSSPRGASSARLYKRESGPPHQAEGRE